MNRGWAGSLAIGLGLLAGAIAGTIVPSATMDQEVRHVAGFTLVFIPILYAVLTTRWEYWQRTSGYVQFAVYLLSFLVSVVALVATVVLVFGTEGSLARSAAFVAALAAFGVALWVTFYGGADRMWAELLARTDIEW